MKKKTVDVLVIGAGPVGLFCANELIRHGLRCRIIDKKSGLSDKSKALGLHIRTLDVLDDCGFIDEVLAQGLKITKVVFKSKGHVLMTASFAGVEADRHFLIDLPQNQTEAILYEGLKNKGIDVEWKTELTALAQETDHVRAIFTKPNGKSEEVSARWLIACDGAHSTTRHLSNMDFVGAAYQQSWWLADLIIDWQLPPDTMHVYLHNSGPLACFPMQEKRYRLVMTSPLGHETEPSFEDIKSVFAERSSDAAVLSNPIWITKFNLHHRQIQHYRKERVFFAGDAAHIHSPMGGQGLNTGIQDAYNLVWKLALVQNKVANETILNSYHAERYPVGLDVLKKTDVMTRMILMKNPLMITLRNTLMSFMMSFNYIRNKLATDLAELAISYKDSPIVADLGSAKGFKSGSFLSNFELKSMDKKKVQTLREITKGTAHHLLLFTGLTNDAEDLIEIANFIEEKYKNIIVPHIVLSQQLSINCSSKVWIDEGQHLHHKYGIKTSNLVLVRPDKYIGLTQSPVKLEQLKDYLTKLLTRAIVNTP